MTSEMPTHFAPAEREDPERLASQHQRVGARFGRQGLMEYSPSIALVLNQHRQVVYFNFAVMENLGVKDPNAAIGKRPGELFQCVHSDEMPGGCGTAEACSGCGAILAILSSLAGFTKETRECLMTRRLADGSLESREFLVTVEPLTIQGEGFLFFAVQDIAGLKRREQLEEVLLHDIRNVATALMGQIEMLSLDFQDEAGRIASLTSVVHGLCDELEGYRMLREAESRDLRLCLTEQDPRALVSEVVRVIGPLAAKNQRTIQLALSGGSISLRSDQALLRRIVWNMLKNAVEASTQAGLITVGVDLSAETVEVWVHNDEVIPREIAPRVFQRSFSTKGVGRGLGTYGIKLLTENYLGGTASFSSEHGKGTRFAIRLPKNR
jgi:signal transduction histidine kinase